MLCQDNCTRELISADPEVSPGPLNDSEDVCRGAYNPMHYNKLKLKNSFIRSNDLLKGCLSIWRLGEPAGTEIAEIVDILQSAEPNGQKLHKVYSGSVSNIRRLTISSHAGRVFSLIDDCIAFENDGKHKAHAVIAICENLQTPELTKESTVFEELRNKLHLAFKANIRWEQAA